MSSVVWGPDSGQCLTGDGESWGDGFVGGDETKSSSQR